MAGADPLAVPSLPDDAALLRPGRCAGRLTAGGAAAGARWRRALAQPHGGRLAGSRGSSIGPALRPPAAQLLPAHGAGAAGLLSSCWPGWPAAPCRRWASSCPCWAPTRWLRLDVQPMPAAERQAAGLGAAVSLMDVTEQRASAWPPTAKVNCCVRPRGWRTSAPGRTSPPACACSGATKPSPSTSCRPGRPPDPAARARLLRRALARAHAPGHRGCHDAGHALRPVPALRLGHGPAQAGARHRQRPARRRRPHRARGRTAAGHHRT